RLVGAGAGGGAGARRRVVSRAARARGRAAARLPARPARRGRAPRAAGGGGPGAAAARGRQRAARGRARGRARRRPRGRPPRDARRQRGGARVLRAARLPRGRPPSPLLRGARGRRAHEPAARGGIRLTAALPLAIRVDAVVRSNRPEGAGAGPAPGASRRLVLEVPGWPGSTPGQFAMLSPGVRGAAPRFDPLLPRPMAVYRATPEPGGAAVEVLYKVSGRGTALLADARPGERVRIVGPLGVGFPLPAPGQRALLVGGGTGIASLHDLAAAARARGPVVVLLGARSAGDLM